MTPVEISEIRNGLGMSQAQIAGLLGVHPLTVSKWERGLLRPTAHQEQLMSTFAKARKVKKTVGDEARDALVAAGVVVALFVLLSAAMEAD